MDESGKLSEFENLRIIYQEIIQGASFSESIQLYIKHLTELENIDILRKKRDFLEYFQKKGLPNETQKMKDLLEQGQWTKEQEDLIVDIRYLISDNEKNLKTLIPQQRPPIEKIVTEKKLELSKLLEEKKDLIGETADVFAERECYNYLIYLSIFKDREVKDKFFKSYNEIDDLEYEDLSRYIIALENTLGKFRENTIKKIAILPTFLNVFSYAKEDISKFYSKPLLTLTSYQLLLTSMGARNLTIRGESGGEPPDMIGDVSLDKVVDWYDLQYSVMLSKRNSGGEGGITKTIREVVK